MEAAEAAEAKLCQPRRQQFSICLIEDPPRKQTSSPLTKFVIELYLEFYLSPILAMALLQRLLSLLLVGLWAVLLLPPSATAGEIAKRGTLTQVTSFGSNPSGTLMYIYVPTTLATKPPIIVAIHQCTGSASEYYESTPYASLADQHGFIVIFPQSPYSGTCWDVSSTAALTHNGGADSNSIANMVTYTLSQYNGDATRVFVTGSSSGAMMTVGFYLC